MQNDVSTLLTKINEAVRAANAAEKTASTAQAAASTAQAAFVSKSKIVGGLLLEAKKLHPTVKEFEAFLKKVKGLKLSRAYDLLRLAGGRTTDAEIRKETRERVKKHREKKKLAKKDSVTSTPVTESQPKITKPVAEQKTFDSPQEA